MRYQNGIGARRRSHREQPAQSSRCLRPLVGGFRIAPDAGQDAQPAIAPERQLGGLPATTIFAGEDFTHRNAQAIELGTDAARLVSSVIVEIALRLTPLEIDP